MCAEIKFSELYGDALDAAEAQGLSGDAAHDAAMATADRELIAWRDGWRKLGLWDKSLPPFAPSETAR